MRITAPLGNAVLAALLSPAADAQDEPPCWNRRARALAAFDTVVLPPISPEAPIPVHFLTPPPGAGQIPLGGHFEIEVAADDTPVSVER